MTKQSKGPERKPSLSTYIVCYHLLPKEDDEKHEDVYGVNPDRIVETDIEIALSEMHGVHVLRDVWIVKVPRTNSRKLSKKLREYVGSGDFLLVSRIQPMWTHGKGIGRAMDLLEELDLSSKE